MLREPAYSHLVSASWCNTNVRDLTTSHPRQCAYCHVGQYAVMQAISCGKLTVAICSCNCKCSRRFQFMNVRTCICIRAPAIVFCVAKPTRCWMQPHHLWLCQPTYIVLPPMLRGQGLFLQVQQREKVCHGLGRRFAWWSNCAFES